MLYSCCENKPVNAPFLRDHHLCNPCALASPASTWDRKKAKRETMAAFSILQDSRSEQLRMFSHPLSKHSMPPKTVQKDPQHLIYKQTFGTPASASLPSCMKMPPLSWGSKAMRMMVYILAVCSLGRGCYVPNYTGNFGEATKIKSADIQPTEG